MSVDPSASVHPSAVVEVGAEIGAGVKVGPFSLIGADVRLDAGVEVNEADKQAFIDASGAIYEEFAGSVDGGAELIEMAQGLAN